MFEKILIANRGEIACRIINTCRHMGISTVAVFSEADAEALHVKLADESCCIGEPAPAGSYLRIDKLLDAAKVRNAQAIHPGYGFLSENAEFARKCFQSGITFIGPSAEAIELMGAKDKAKAVMEQAGVAVVPGYFGAEQSQKFLLSEAEKIGYPLMIKAVFGGGGKGMRVVQKEEKFEDALRSAQNEARKAFGDERVMLERFVSEPRHIEFQIFGDQHGNVMHLFERDCSPQRRHQKIVEESPSLFLDQKLREKMAEAAVAAAKAVNYTGAGTIEFIVANDSSFYFMEMNTRLQVEHPVTELITGLDLVEWQLRIAAGEKLPLKQSKIKQNGHAIEARIYAENPETGFLPSTGTLHRLVFPETEEINHESAPEAGISASSVRIDTGVEEGDEISIHYDPMIAKLIVHADSRKNAIQTMRSALAHTAVLGVETNLGFLQKIMSDPDFEASQVDTLFVDSKLESLLESKEDSADWIYRASAISCFLEDSLQAEKNAQNAFDPWSPWNKLSNWRVGGCEPYRVQLRNHKGEETEINFACDKNTFKIINAKETISVSVIKNGNLLELNWNNENSEESGSHLLVLHHDKQLLLAVHEHGRSFFTRLDPLSFKKKEVSGEFRLSAPMPGNVIRVLVKAGERVSRGQQLLVMEAMKMEHTIVAPSDGIVEKVHYNVGDLVQNEAELIKFSQLGISTGSP